MYIFIGTEKTLELIASLQYLAIGRKLNMLHGIIDQKVLMKRINEVIN
jgi:hypothetical protein